MSVAEGSFSILLWRTSLAGVLLGAVATLYFFAGLAGYVTSPLPNFFVAAALASAVFFFFCEFLHAFGESQWLGRCLWLAILVIIVVEVMLGFVPPTARDELTHHLAIPRLYAQAGRIIEIPIAPYSYYPMLLDMLYTPWVYWGYDSVPKLIHALFGYLAAMLLYAYLSRRMSSVYGLLGFFFFISIPSVLRLSHWAYVDLGITFYTTAAILCVLRWREERDKRSWLVLAGLSAGFAIATKPNGLVALLLLGLIFAWDLAKKPERGFRRIISELALFGAVSVLPFLPWAAKNWYQTGNPFFPLLTGVFSGKGGGGGGAGVAGVHVSLGVFAKRELLYGESWWQIAALPLRVFFSGQDDNPQYFDGVLSPALILLLPWAFKGKWREDKKFLLNFAVLFFLYSLFLVDLRIRYIFLIVPPLVALFAYGVFNLYLRIKRPAYLILGLLFFVGFHGFYLYRYFREAAPIAYLLGKESRTAYLTRALPEYSTFEFINRQLPPSARIYLLFIGRRGYYCERDYFHDGGDLPVFLLGAINSTQESAQVERILRDKKITHLMVRTDLLARYLGNNLSPAKIALWNEFAVSRLSLKYQAHGYALYQLHG